MKPTYEDLEVMVKTREKKLKDLEDSLMGALENRDRKIRQLQDTINGLKLKNQEYIKALKSKEYTICRQRERLNIHGKFLRDMEVLMKYWRDHGHTF